MGPRVEQALKALIQLGKFVGLIVVPITVWFLALRQEVARASLDIVGLQSGQEAMQIKQEEIRDRINDQYLVIMRELGEIRGELKRIKR